MWQRNVAVSIHLSPCSHRVSRARFTVALFSLLSVKHHNRFIDPLSNWRDSSSLFREPVIYVLFFSAPASAGFFVLFFSTVNMEKCYG